MQFSIILKVFSFLALFCLSACQTKELSPFEQAKNPYAHLGVEGYMGAAMTSCLGMAPQGPPIVRKKDGATVVPDDHSPEQSSYCLLYTSPSPRDKRQSRMPSSA